MSDHEPRSIRVRGARTHNLQGISLDVPRDKLVVITGLSGSGKSSLAFDTIYAEGQRKFVESLSAYARQFLEQMSKPDVDHISGLPPTIAISQRAGVTNPRSTVATTTEIYDYLRLLFARIGTPHCFKCGRPITRQTVRQIVDSVMTLPENTRAMVLAPMVRGQRGEHREVISRVLREGFVRIRVNGELHEIKGRPTLSKNKKHTIEAVVDRVVIRPDVRTRLAESIETSLQMSDGLVVIADQPAAAGRARDNSKWRDTIYSERYACTRCGTGLPGLEPRIFSFNSPHGACSACDGLGTILEFDPDLIVPDGALSLDHGAIEPWRRGGKQMTAIYTRLMKEFCICFGVSPATPFNKVPKHLRDVLMWGTTADDEQSLGHHFEGVIPNLDRRWKSTDSESVKSRLHAYLSERSCKDCGGARLRPESLAVRLDGTNIDDIARMSIDGAVSFFDALELSGERKVIAASILKEIRERLRFMADVGIGYLTLNRASKTLSGGESQRIRLATQVGSGLVGVCYVLDEPTVGLHQRDTAKLIDTLRRLTSLGNTVLVVEHDVDTIRAADWIIDIGPGAGAHGGRITAEGTYQSVLASPESVTARYLRGELSIEKSGKRRRVNKRQCIEVRGAAENNLKGIDVSFPLGVFCCVTGVSGSGKSTLVNTILLRALKRRLQGGHDRPGAHERIVGVGRIDKIIEIDQSPIGRTPRSNPATYTGVFDMIRSLYAKTREAKIRGYGAGRFSFNVKGGRCEACQGQGTKRIEMHFLPDVFVRCAECKGTRYSRETLEVRFRGKSIADVLSLRVDEALTFFASFSAIKQLLQALADVGLGYITLGQSSATLSGGEAQRVKLAAELGRSAIGHTLYVLDEPTTGLHFADIHNLLDVLNRLCTLGHTILVIEHNLDVIRQADWVIDLGPEGGDAGGEIIAEGTPEQIAAVDSSYTGRFLKGRLETPS
ncbi:MAG: excinuclease ABC subunit UvrA [Planctomycetota bacterium]|nr:excinuclease ABC subunit UvrA [Planctomycetota bacterium]